MAPTTVSPTTVAPTTVAPTTVAPTTVAPTTVSPTTVAPTTVNPSNITITQAYVDSTTFPVTVTGGTEANPVQILLTKNVITDKNIQFVIPSGNYVTFDGQGKTITLNGVTDYTGLIGSDSTNTIVQDLAVLSTNNSTLLDSNGWIGTKNFQGSIKNCYSTGDVNDGCGGIVGWGAGTGTGGSCYIFNCYSTGSISGSSGGISGGYAGANGGICTISNCYSTGNIGGNSGGIMGYNSGVYGTCTVNNCYSTGSISYSSGGIAGSGSGTCTINNCYSTGDIISLSGGITADYCSCIITNCYVTGTVDNVNYVFVGPSSIVTPESTNNVHTDGWIDSSANTVLDMTVFIKVSPSSITNIPYRLLSFLYRANASLEGTTLTYTNVWPITSTPVDQTSTYVIDNNGVIVSRGTSTLDATGRQITLTGVMIVSTKTLYSLVVSGNYIDKFELIGSYLVRVKFDANYVTVINSPTATEAFKLSVKRSVAEALNIPITSVTVLNLTPGSIIAEIYIQPELIPQLQTIVESGNLAVEYNGESYPANKNYFVVVDAICFHRDTLILTPSGYRKVQDLQKGDLVKTAQGRVVPVKRMVSFIGTESKCPLYVLHKDSIAPSVPMKDLYMSEGHAFRKNGNWHHMKCSDLATKVDMDNIEYYNIVLDNYLENTLVANGVEVESLFDMTGLKMHWKCEEDCCKPVIERSKDL